MPKRAAGGRNVLVAAKNYRKEELARAKKNRQKKNAFKVFSLMAGRSWR